MQDMILDTTQRRLEEINKEIASLNIKKEELYKRWLDEKNLIQQIRAIKEEIDNTKHKSDEYERQGELAKVAELRYGKIIDLQKKLKLSNDKLNDIQLNGKLLKENIDSEDIAEIVAQWTNIPIQKMLETERTKLILMEERIHQRIIGQQEAVTAISNAIRRSRAGIQDPKKPVGSFIFFGSTGVGKTEMARALAEYLFDDDNALIRIDMSEYTEKFSISRLIGAPPGYIGYEEGGQLTEAIRQKPYSVVLLDEIEKAHQEVFNVLLQVLDDGRLTDGKGRTVNFRNSIIIMTSNLGSEIIQDKILDINESNRDFILDDIKEDITELLKKQMRPEFLNRIDEIILFKPLTKNEIIDIAKLQLDNLNEKILALGINITYTQQALERLAIIGFDIQYGARPLKRAIQKYIADPLAMKLLKSEFVQEDSIVIDWFDSEEFVFYKKK